MSRKVNGYEAEYADQLLRSTILLVVTHRVYKKTTRRFKHYKEAWRVLAMQR